MKNMLVVDSHSDYLEKSFDEKLDITNKKLQFNLNEVYWKRPYIQFSSIFININNKDEGYIRANNMIDYFDAQYIKYKDEYSLKKINNISDLNKVITNNKIGLLLTIENLGFIGDNISRIEELYNKGARVMSLTWNYKNLIATGIKEKIDNGITEFGYKCIDKINDLGCIIDVSHLSKNSFKDLMKICNNKKIIATHSCVRKLCDNVRNLDDYEIKYIASMEGYIGINYYNNFLTNKKNYAIVDDVIDHITYISNLVGIKYVGLGSDFDGVENIDLPMGLKGVKDIDNLIDRLITRRFSTYEIGMVIGKNIYSYLKNNI